MKEVLDSSSGKDTPPCEGNLWLEHENQCSLYRTHLLDRCWWSLLQSGYLAVSELLLAVREQLNVFSFDFFLTHLVHLDILGAAPPASLTINLSPPFFLLTPPRLTFFIFPPRHQVVFFIYWRS